MAVLIRHELNVNELVTLLAMGQSRISRHLKILTDSGLLEWRRDGLWIFYRAVTTGPGNVFLQAVRPMIEADPAIVAHADEVSRRLDQGRQETARFFDALATDWDTVRGDLLGALDLPGAITSKVAPCAIAADLGCGTGGLLPVLRQRARRVIGVDKSQRMLDEARKRLAGDGSGIELRLGEIEHLPMGDGEADAAVINMVLHHLPSPAEGIREAARVVRRGGGLLIVDLEKHENEEMRRKYHHRWLGFTRTMISDWLGQNGFAPGEVDSMPGGQGLTVNLISAVRQ